MINLFYLPLMTNVPSNQLFVFLINSYASDHTLLSQDMVQFVAPSVGDYWGCTRRTAAFCDRGCHSIKCNIT